jgi:cyclopropane-fatty-acyl-phospholipid synthase
MTLLDRVAKRAVLHRMSRIAHGRLTVRCGGVSHDFGSGGAPAATMIVEDRAFFRSLALRGHIGAAESYVRGEWDSPELSDVMRLFARNREALDGLERGWARLARPALAALRLWNRNTRRGSARNIQAHYDLGNEFFAAFLDETMTYSCGIFESGRASLRDASVAKYDRICRKLELGPSDHVIEIGSGWGGFAVHAASTYGCRVTTTTISREQHRLAGERVAEAGLKDRVTVLLRDYRDLEGEYDKLVSIEMIEAVGHQYLGEYFEKCASLLAPDGLAAIQAITVQDSWYDPKQRQVDFIKRYIFPGGQLPSVGAICNALACGTDLRLTHLEDLTANYVLTLARWREAFRGHWRRIRGLGYPEPFLRLWELYLSACEGWFAERAIGVAQIALAKPLCRAGPRAGTLEPA